MRIISKLIRAVLIVLLLIFLCIIIFISYINIYVAPVRENKNKSDGDYMGYQNYEDSTDYLQNENPWSIISEPRLRNYISLQWAGKVARGERDISPDDMYAVIGIYNNSDTDDIVKLLTESGFRIDQNYKFPQEFGNKLDIMPCEEPIIWGGGKYRNYGIESFKLIECPEFSEFLYQKIEM